MAKHNIPRHVGFIPDGNRRWATDHVCPKKLDMVMVSTRGYCYMRNVRNAE